MLYFKGCPKCKTGAIEHASDSWGQYLQCLMCGYQRDFETGTDPVAELAKAHREFAAAAMAAEGGEQAAVA